MMGDRLADLVVGLQRMAENARIRGDDLKYMQQQDDYEHLKYLDELLSMAQRLHSTLIDERRRFIPVEHPTPTQLNKPPQDESIPRVVTKGPLPAHLRPKEQSTG